MFRRGVNYDVGIVFNAQYMSRPDLDSRVVGRELTIIRDDLHCDAVRISGTDPQRLAGTATAAVDLGLQVWVSPHRPDATPLAMMEDTLDCAARVAHLADAKSRVVFVVGCELGPIHERHPAGSDPAAASAQPIGNAAAEMGTRAEPPAQRLAC